MTRNQDWHDELSKLLPHVTAYCRSILGGKQAQELAEDIAMATVIEVLDKYHPDKGISLKAFTLHRAKWQCAGYWQHSKAKMRAGDYQHDSLEGMTTLGGEAIDYDCLAEMARDTIDGLAEMRAEEELRWRIDEVEDGDRGLKELKETVAVLRGDLTPKPFFSGAWSPFRDEEIVEHTKAIAAYYGRRTNWQPKLTSEQWSHVQARWEDGASCEEAGRIYQVSASSVYKRSVSKRWSRSGDSGLKRDRFVPPSGWMGGQIVKHMAWSLRGSGNMMPAYPYKGQQLAKSEIVLRDFVPLVEAAASIEFETRLEGFVNGWFREHRQTLVDSGFGMRAMKAKGY